MSKIKDTFESIFYKYWRVMSLKELSYFSNQLALNGYNIRIKRSFANITIVYEKPSLKDYFQRVIAKLKGVNLKLMPYQRYIYKI